jgi:hypothetical protein
MSAILGALIEAGLTITMFREHDVLPWRRDAAQVTARPGQTVALSGDVQSLVPSPPSSHTTPRGFESDAAPKPALEHPSSRGLSRVAGSRSSKMTSTGHASI